MDVTREAIVYCYYILLSRMPRNDEIDFFIDVAIQSGIVDISRIRSMIMNSEEYRLQYFANIKANLYDDMSSIEYMGLKFMLPRGDFTAVSAQNMVGYEPNVSSHLFKRLKEGNVFLDIGANTGLFAVPAAMIVGDSGEVLAFEASAANAKLLSQNATRNGLRNVKVFPLGLADYNGTALSGNDTFTTNRILLPPGMDTYSDTLDIMPIVTLDSFLEYNRRIDMIKLDVEGYEYRVLMGAQNIIAVNKPEIYMEYSDGFQRHGSNVPGATLLQLLSNMGYDFTILHRTRPPEFVAADDKISYIDGFASSILADGETHIDLYLSLAGFGDCRSGPV